MKTKEKNTDMKKLLKIGTAESSLSQLNELIQHRESDFAMFYHKDKDKWIALVLSNWILEAFDEQVEYSS